MFTEALHPRVPSGATAGQFASGGGGKTPAKKAPAKKAAPARKSGGGSTLSFDGERGAGYGVKGGDARVKDLQEALNRLGLTDASGKKLVIDGKYGPKTTAAVKAAQRKLGLTADGKVTPDLLKKLTAAKSLPKTAPTAAKKAVKKAPGRTPVRRSEVVVPALFDRTFPLDDIQISRSGDGRTVEAYAAMFEAPYEVRDQHGHYMEVLSRSVFNRTLSGGAGKSAMCLYNHGMTVHGTPDMMGSVPLGTPLEIRPDGRGLLTVTRYNKGPFADQVLESIRNGDIRAQSFRGRIIRSDPNGRVPRQRYGQTLPTVTRHEMGLTDYGPTPIPVNAGAEIVAVRSLTDLIDELRDLDADEREELLRTLDLSTPAEDPDDEEEEDDVEDDVEAISDDSEPGAEDPPLKRHSIRQIDIRRRIRAALVTRSMT
jgi:HK97 family phage prohead protease